MQTHRNQITRIVDRVPFICEWVARKSVLDIGCGSWPNTQELINDDALPHFHYSKTASSIVGLDISGQSLLILNKLVGGTDYLRWDFQYGPMFVKGVEDVILGECLEHMSRPGEALLNIATSTEDDVRLIATVPNAFAYTAYQRACDNEEWVHEEHVAWYSPATLTQLLERHGWKVTELLGYCPQGRLPAGASMLQAAGIIAIAEKG